LEGRNLSKRNVEGGIEELNGICDAAIDKLPSKEMGGEAVHRAVEAVRASFSGKSFQDCMDEEMSIFLDLLSTSKQGNARRHAFFAERVATSPPPGVPKVDVRGSNKVGVIGAGTMGSGIATCFLRAGYEVTLVDVKEEGLKRGEGILKRNIEQDVKRGRATKEKAEGNLSRLSTSTSLQALNESDIVIEAVFENMDLKKRIFKEVSGEGCEARKCEKRDETKRIKNPYYEDNIRCQT